MKQTFLCQIVGAIAVGLIVFTGCEPDTAILNELSPTNSPISAVTKVSTVSSVSTNPKSQTLPARSPETILIASFNIQVFGESKVNDRWVMERLAEVIRRFDVVAIQEVRSKDQNVLPALLSYVNATGGRYDYLLGPRLGRSDSKEQYAFVYDSTRINTGKDFSYTLNDDIDALHREPMIARFVVRTSLTAHPWSFSLVNLHTDPDEATAEVDSMGGILREIRNYEFMTGREDDVILLGDFNAPPAKMGSLQALANVRPLIVNQPTNVKENELYDNLLIDPSTTTEFTGSAGVSKMRELFGISMAEALKLSDHNPVWAEFRVEERSSQNLSQMAAQPYVAPR